MIRFALFSTKEDTIETNNERKRSKVHSGIRDASIAIRKTPKNTDDE